MTPILVVIVCTFIIFTNGQQFNFLQRNLIGSQCQRPSDCGDGMGCGSGRCQCLVSYIQVDRRCLRKLDPGDSPCQVDAQCQAAWPTSRCQNTICQCTRGAKVRTRDGIVCVEHAKCPVGGADAVLKETSGTPVTCSRDGNGRVSGCNNQLHMYDCIADKFNGKGYCCPNKAATCASAPAGGPGFGLAYTRYYFDAAKQTCSPFRYSGSGGNSNSFETQQQCQNYCQACPRGNPQFSSSSTGGGIFREYFERVTTCDPSTGGFSCTDPRYQCTLIGPGNAVCCPKKRFVCGPNGGSTTSSGSGYSEGVPCGPGSSIQTRYYYNSASQSCQTFHYKGCGGNFNNFATLVACQSVCGPSAPQPASGLGNSNSNSNFNTNNRGNNGSFSPDDIEFESQLSARIKAIQTQQTAFNSGNNQIVGVSGQQQNGFPTNSQSNTFSNANNQKSNVFGNKNTLQLTSFSDAIALGGRPDLRVLENGRVSGIPAANTFQGDTAGSTNIGSVLPTGNNGKQLPYYHAIMSPGVQNSNRQSTSFAQTQPSSARAYFSQNKFNDAAGSQFSSAGVRANLWYINSRGVGR